LEYRDIWTELARADSLLAHHLCELRDQVLVTLTLDEKCTYEGSAQVLRARANIKRGQADAACSPESRSRYELMGSAISHVVDWWDNNQSTPLRYVCLEAEPDACFILWFRADDGAYLDGFESRRASKLTFERGKAFFGNDWNPPADPGF
jgi:hypothetical protein